VPQTASGPRSADPDGIAREVLVVGPDDWAVRRASRELEDAGRVAHHCYDSADTPFPCNALVPGRGCPLDVRHVDVVVTVRARPRREPGLSEMGAICGLRQGIPLVVAGLGDASGFARWAVQVPIDGDVVTTCDQLIRATGR
jgi:hypothetical protein